MNLFDRLLPGHALVACIVFLLVTLAMRLADERGNKANRNHLLIAGGALMAFGLVVRLVDVLTHIEAPRWSSVIGGLGVLAFMASDQHVAARYSRAWARMAGLTVGYYGPDRRRASQPHDEER